MSVFLISEMGGVADSGRYSYELFQEFGYPSKYSFIEWTKRLIDNINSRFPAVKVSDLPYKSSIFSISIYESIVSFKVSRQKCFESFEMSNNGISMDAVDFRHKGREVFSVNQDAKWLKKLNKGLAKFITRHKISDLKKYF